MLKKGESVIGRTISLGRLSWTEEAAEAAGDFISLRLPLFLAWFACGVVVLLVLFVGWMSFVSGTPIEPILSLQNFADALDDYLFWRVIPNTAIVGLGTVAVVLFFSVPSAWLLYRTNVPLRELWITLIAVAVIVPGFLKAIGWIMLLNPRIGLINMALVDIFGLERPPFSIHNVWGISFVQGLMLSPTMFFLLAGPVRSMDPALEEAAQVSGATKWRTMRWVSLPMLWPAILGGSIYTFMTAVSIFEIAALLGGIGRTPVLATELFLNLRPIGEGIAFPRYGMAGVYGLLIAVPSLFALYYYLRVIEKGHRYVVVTGKGYRPRDFDLGRARYVGLAFVLLYLLLAVMLPLLVLVWASLLPRLAMPSTEALSLLSLRWYWGIMDIIGGTRVLTNTLVLMVMTPVVVLFFSFMISWVVVRTKAKGRKVMDTVAMLPHAIPGLGFAFALTVLAILAAKWMPWLPLYQTIGVIVLANAVNRLSYATRIINAALLQVGRELEESAQVCGARRLGTMWWVIAPLIKPSLLFGGIWTGLLVFREISMALMLSGPKNQVLSIRIWHHWEHGRLSEASALGVLMVLAMGALIFIAQRFAGFQLGTDLRPNEGIERTGQQA
jgi:iron(III) transport system permease protein